MSTELTIPALAEHIFGQGGGGGDSHTPTEAPNSIRSKTTARVLFLLSRGTIRGLADQVDRMKSVYFDNSVVQNEDGSFNKANVALEERYGLPSQEVMPGYSMPADSINVGAHILYGTPVVYTTSVGYIDTVRLTIRFVAMFKQESNGDTNGTTVTFNIYRKLGAGAYSLYKTITKTGKNIQPADVDYPIERPNPGGTGVWSVKVEKVTSEPTTSTLANDLYLQFATEIQNVQLPYNGYAVTGVTTTAETTGNSFPTVAFDAYGLLLKVPSNYTVSTRTYTGVWDGTFKSAAEWSDNPVWVVYYLLTDPDGGMGSIIDPGDIDQYSFYEAAVYCDGLAPTADGSATEPRYTFNYQFMEQSDPWTMIQNTAASFGAAVYSSGNRIRLVQDRPTNYSRLITNSNVIDGFFEYTSTTRAQRSSACMVYWNNPDENFLSVPAYYEDTDATESYGYNCIEVTGLGITSEGQALRLAKWHVDTSINNTDAASFKVGFSNAGLEPGEVVSLMDSTFAEVMNEAKIATKTDRLLQLDRVVNVAVGNTIDVLGANGMTLYTRPVTSVESMTSITFGGDEITIVPGADMIITGAVSPRLFKITNVKEDSPGVYSVSAVQYDPNKFGRVDDTPTGLVPVYQQLPSMTVVSPVTDFVFLEESYTDAEGKPVRFLSVHWSPALGQFITAYRVYWSKDDGDVIDGGTLVQPNTRIPVDVDGLYSITVYAVNSRGVSSIPATGLHSVNLSAPVGASPLVPITGLTVKGGGTNFNGTDCTVVWTDPNVSGAAVVASYEVKVEDAASPSTVYRTELVTEPTYTYDLTKQQADNGAALKRTFIISVRVKDTWGRFSTAVAATFTNPSPATVTGIVATGSFKNNFVSWNAVSDPDVRGYIVWRGSSAGFTVSSSNQIFDGLADTFVDSGLPDSTTYWYKIAAYDVFGKDYAGTGLNIGASGAVSTLNADLQNEYKLLGVTWTPNSPSANHIAWTSGTVVKALGVGSGGTWSISAGNAAWTSGILYVYYHEGDSTLSTTTTLSTAIAVDKIILATYRGGTDFANGNGNAFQDGSYIIAGTVGAAQLVTGSAVITGSAQISNAIVTDAKITNLDGSKINANSITAIKIDTRGLDIKDSSGTVIFSSGTPLASSYITPAAGWVNSNIAISGGAITGIGTGNGTAVANSNISISSSGVLSGAGGGAVTIAGLGYSGDLNATNDVKLVARGACTISGNTIGKSGGSSAWDSDVYSASALPFGCMAQATATDAGANAMFGLNSDPLTDGSYASIDYAMFFGAGGNLSKYENGAGVSIGTYAAGDTGIVMYDGSYVRYFLNGTQVSTTYVGNPALILYFDSSLYTPGVLLKNVRFLPTGNPSAIQPSNPITSGNASTYIASAAIGSAQVGVLNAGNINVSSLSALSANMGSLTSGSVHGGFFHSGGFTNAYAWPPSGQNGFHLSGSGLLIGNYYDGKYFQVNANGDLYSTQFTIVGGAATFSGNLSAASGSFSGNLTTTGVVTASNIAANSLTTSYSASSGGGATSVTVVIPAGARAVTAQVHSSGVQQYTYYGSGKDSSYYYSTIPAPCSLSSSIGSGSGLGSTAFAVNNPTAGTYTFSASRSGESGASVIGYTGNLVLIVLVTNK